jgi:hypothetical protein
MSPGKNLARPYLKKKPDVVAHIYSPSYSGKCKRIAKAHLEKKHELLLEKQTKRKVLGGALV